MTPVSNGHARRLPVASMMDRGTVWPIDDMLRQGPPRLREATGLLAGTRVSTEFGWRAVEDLRPGDRVLTFDDGLQPVAHVALIPAAGPRTVMQIPKSALGNRAALRVVPGQRLLIDTASAESVIGEPFVLIRAQALLGYKGIVPAMDKGPSVRLVFDRPQMVFAEGSAVLHCHGPERACTDPGVPMLSPAREVLLAARLRRGAQGTAQTPAQPWGAAQAARPRLVS